MGVAKDPVRCALHCVGFYNMQPIHACGWLWFCRRFDLPARQCGKKIESGSGKGDRRDFPARAGVFDEVFINLGGRRKPLKISDQTSETWSCVWPEYGADESAAHGSARNPKPPCRVGPAAAPIELEGGRVIESVLAKHDEVDRIR